jgi:hypothetical protein
MGDAERVNTVVPPDDSDLEQMRKETDSAEEALARAAEAIERAREATSRFNKRLGPRT